MWKGKVRRWKGRKVGSNEGREENRWRSQWGKNGRKERKMVEGIKEKGGKKGGKEKHERLDEARKVQPWKGRKVGRKEGKNKEGR